MGLGASGRTPGNTSIVIIDANTLCRICRHIGIPGRKCLAAGHIVEGIFQFMKLLLIGLVTFKFPVAYDKPLLSVSGLRRA